MPEWHYAIVTWVPKEGAHHDDECISWSEVVSLYDEACAGCRRGYYVQAGSSDTKEIYSLAKVHAVFSSQTVKCFAHVFYKPFRKPDPSGGFRFLFFLPDFSFLKFFLKIWTTLDQTFSAKNNSNKTPPAGQASAWTYRTCMKKIMVLSLKNGVDIWTFVRKKV